MTAVSHQLRALHAPTAARAAAGSLALIAFAASAVAQPIQQSATPAVTRVDLKPVEQGIGDVSPLSTNLRTQPTDLRMPIRFDRVFRLSDVAATQPSWRGPGRLNSRGDAQPEGFVRFNAGVSAVFPFSAYSPGRGGLVTEVPPGTVFHLGLKPQPADGRFSVMDSPTQRAGTPLNAINTAAPSDARPNTPINRLVDTSAAANAVSPAPESAPQNSLWTSEAYRHERLTTLINSLPASRRATRDIRQGRSSPTDSTADSPNANRAAPASAPAQRRDQNLADPPSARPAPRR